jgi:N-acetylmuramic acid 6-phosphate etherase
VGAAWLALNTLGYPLEARVTPPTASAENWMSEQVNRLTRDLDLRTTLDMVTLMHTEDWRAVAAVRPTLPVIAQVVDAIADRMRRGGRLIYVGSGTSGRLGILDATECPPTFNALPDQVIGVIAGGYTALTRGVEGAEDDADGGRQALADLNVREQDSVVCIAASGRTPYVIGAAEEARRRGALTVALVCNLPAPLAQHADYVLASLVGPEVIAGSTRLKAGTAQKLALNMLSTAVMVRLGKTYGNLMVDVRAENAKLHARARRIVAQACRISEEEAGTALVKSGGEVKVAIVSDLAGCSPQAARERLARAGGVVRAALALEALNPDGSCSASGGVQPIYG